MVKGYTEFSKFCEENKLNKNIVYKIAKKYKVNIIWLGELSFFKDSEMERALLNFFNDRNEFINKKRQPRPKLK